MSTREQRVLVIRALRDAGLTQSQIAAQIGLAKSTVNDYICDPTGEKVAARKAGYGGTCEVCGKRTDGGRGRAKAPRRCVAHHATDAVILKRGQLPWNRERLIAAIREFACRYGRPPAASDWNPGLAKSFGREDKAFCFYEDDCWPAAETVQRYFGSWNAGIVAAGFTPTQPGHYRRTPAVRARMSAAQRARWERVRA